jgi:homoserine O-acetyltransferase
MKGITKIIRLYDSSDPLRLENGKSLDQCTVAYETHGKLNSDGTNVVLICHALTGDAHVGGEAVYTDDVLHAAPLLRTMKSNQLGWWDGVVGPGKLFDTEQFFVVSSNILGSCYGTCGPASLNPDTKRSYKTEFPQITIRDMVNVQYRLMIALGVQQIALVTGGSLGGMQAIEWAIMYPEMVKSLVPIATAAQHSAWCIGINHLGREAIVNDPVWNNGNYEVQPVNGLALARKIGMVSYRSDIIFNLRFARERVGNNGRPKNIFQVESYLNYQGEKLVKRFDANCYLYLTHAMDHHDIARGRGSVEAALASIRAKTLCVGIDSDILYPVHEQKSIARCVPDSRYAEIKSEYGHDAFLIEFEQLHTIIGPLLKDITMIE